MASTGPRTVTGHAAALARDAAIGFVRRYHRLAVTVDAPVPAGPTLLVANHGFGGITDLNVFAALAALDSASLDAPLDIQVHQLAWALGVGPALEQIGCRPAGRDTAAASLASGHHLLVLPGGDLDAFKPHSQRNRIVFGGRRGFARLALEHQVPIVPVVTQGAGDTLYVLSDGSDLARTLRLDRLTRLKALPISLSVPWGLNVGLVGLVPYLPLPVTLSTAVLPAVHPGIGETAEGLARRVEDAMQHRLTTLAAP